MFQLLFILIPLPGYLCLLMPLDPMLEQSYNKKYPLAFYSKKLSAPESRNSTFDRELFAAYSSLRHFRFMLEGRQFILFTDHKPLTFALFRTSPPWSAMQQRRLFFLSEFNCEICHLPGSENVVADDLSRPEPSNVPQNNLSTTLVSELQPTPQPPVPGISLSEMSLLQQSCPKIEFLGRSSALSVISVPYSGSNLLCDMSTGILRPLVLEKMRRTVFDLIHNYFSFRPTCI